MNHGRHVRRSTLVWFSIASAFGLLGGNQAHAEGWVTVTNQNCKVWSNDPDNTGITWTATWTGACKNGFADGPGVEEWFKNGVFDQRLNGELSHGKRSGVGTYTWASGNRYEGPFVNDERTGKGKFSWASGATYEGDFVAGKRTGRGIYVWPNGDRYEGDFVNDERTGKGKLRWVSGTTYEGDFIAGKLTGKGIYVWPDGNRYEGDMVDAKREGQGYLLEANGNSYRGQWADNMVDGPGAVTFAGDGSVRAGQFVKGKIFDGTDTRADGTLIATYSGGVRTSATDSSDDGPGVLSFVAGLLGAAAQGVASGGGRNAAQFQAVATALQATSGASSSPSPSPSALPVPASPSANYNAGTGGNVASAGRKTIAPLTGCIEQVRIPRGAKGHGGWYDVETGIKNTCGYAVIVAWCVTGDKGPGDTARCETNYSGFYGLSPGEQHSLGSDRFGTLQTLICKDPARPLDITWSGTRFTGHCVLI
ncbi:hypothetical protein UC34_25305 [Pandoraea vervacti]|uniref:MORN repeat-containing protein n=1 Tax=Pandoraea vervacti TaxID=656178 RepID=A0ABM6FR23_9BURK|nr:hypothetical protein [Pandoraea vervacti]APD11266.1 hypothetical protein UC34_25305 [Pandoraea vervacti]